MQAVDKVLRKGFYFVTFYPLFPDDSFTIDFR